MINCEDNGVNPLVTQLTHRPFQELADVLRAAPDPITPQWGAAARDAMLRMRHLTFDESKDSTPEILRTSTPMLADKNPQLEARQGLDRLRPFRGVGSKSDGPHRRDQRRHRVP